MAKISPVGSNMTVLHGKKYDVLFSYETPVAAKDIKTGEVFKTSKKWSATTSKHISKWLAGEKASEKPQEFFDDLDESKKDPAKQIAEALNIMLKGKTLNESNEEESEDGIWWSSSSGDIEIQLTKDQAESASVGGVDNESAIDDLLTNPEISSQFDDISDDALKSELKGYGAWDDEELSDREMNIKRVLWLAAGDISDGLVEGDMNESEDEYVDLDEDDMNESKKYSENDFLVFDSGGETMDRYTIILKDDEDNADSRGMIPVLISGKDPRGRSGHEEIRLHDLLNKLYVPDDASEEDIKDAEEFLGKEIDFSTLPDDVQKFVLNDYNSRHLYESNLNESTSDWSNKQVIDSRDIIERLQELEDDVENLDESDKEELELLRAVNEDGQNYSDWEHGESLINDSYWVDYVQEMLEDTGDIPKDLPNYIVIDWESTARNIQYDYVSIDVGGTDFWIRNS